MLHSPLYKKRVIKRFTPVTDSCGKGEFLKKGILALSYISSISVAINYITYFLGNTFFSIASVLFRAFTEIERVEAYSSIEN